MCRDITRQDDAFRDARLKMIPRAAAGSFIVRHTIGSTPALIGKKLTVRYFRGASADGERSYFEADVDLASSSVAGAARTF